LDRLDSAFAVADLDRLLELHGVNPRYPEVLRRSRLDGIVELEYVISAGGLVEAGTIQVRSSPHVAFSKSARDAVRNARFKPALRGERPVAVLVRQRIHFLNQ
jgi:TonB family protein